MSSSIPLSGLDVSAFSLGGTDLYALLKMAKLGIDVDMANVAGIGQSDEVNQAVKSEQKFDFSVMQLDSGGFPCTSLSVSLWSLAGTAYLGQLRGGSIEATTVTRERSSIANPYKVPNPNARQLTVSSDLLVVVASDILNAMLVWDGDSASLNCAVAITYGLSVFTKPMIFKSSSIEMKWGEMQMENPVAVSRGIATGPDDDSLLGNMILGAAALSLSLNTGLGAEGLGSGGTAYATGEDQVAIIDRLGVRFADGQVLTNDGTLTVQGTVGVTDN